MDDCGSPYEWPRPGKTEVLLLFVAVEVAVVVTESVEPLATEAVMTDSLALDAAFVVQAALA